MSEAPIESPQFIGWWRDAIPDAITSSAYTGERAIHSSDFSAEKNPVGSVRSLAANAASRSLFREQGLREWAFHTSGTIYQTRQAENAAYLVQ